MYTRKKIILSFAGMFFLLLLMMSASLFFGSVLLNPKEILSCLIQNDRTSVTGLLLFHIRIPRMFGAIAAGMGLSCAGVILQTVMNNSLASPNTIGVNSGAGFTVMIGLAIFHGRAAHNAILLLPELSLRHFLFLLWHIWQTANVLPSFLPALPFLLF